MSPSIQKIKEGGSYPGIDEKKKYTVNDIIKDARKDTKHTVSNSQPLMLNERKVLRKLQLEPIKKDD